MVSTVKKFIGTITDGKLRLDHMDWFKAELGRLNGKRIYICVEVYRQKRSLTQNGWYWGVAIPLLGEFCGNTAEQMHEILKRELRPEVNKFGHVVGASTSAMDTAEFSRYMDDVVFFGASLGVAIPMPGDLPADKTRLAA